MSANGASRVCDFTVWRAEATLVVRASEPLPSAHQVRGTWSRLGVADSAQVRWDIESDSGRLGPSSVHRYLPHAAAFNDQSRPWPRGSVLVRLVVPNLPSSRPKRTVHTAERQLDTRRRPVDEHRTRLDPVGDPRPVPYRW
jgi:hypothetical protein